MTDENDKDPPYPVGYRKPPKRTQFAPGKSGNPRGRKRGSKNFGTVIDSELEQPVIVNEGGRRRKITKLHAFAKQLVNKAVAGDPRAMPLLLNETRLHETEASAASPQSFIMTQEDELVLESMVKRIRESTPTSAACSPETGSQSAPPSSDNLAGPADERGE